MGKASPETGKVLITGGTSGLGLGLVRFFLEKGWDVVATGRKYIKGQVFSDRFSFFMTDFCDLRQTSDTVKQICKKHSFDLVINNAGVLSPPKLMITADGNEYTFQVNFLSHLLLNEIVLMNAEQIRPLRIAAVVSPVYKIADTDLLINTLKTNYNPVRAYSNSKLYLVLMCNYLPLRYSSIHLNCISYDPGVFRSKIFRMQKKWFRSLYKVATPFMRNPVKISSRFGEIIRRNELVNGAVYRSGGKSETVPVIKSGRVMNFWSECYNMIEPFLKD